MPGYTNSDDVLAELEFEKSEKLDELKNLIKQEQEKKKRVEKDMREVSRDYVKNSFPTFKFALRGDLAKAPEFLPSREHDTDTGWDVRCAERNDVVLRPFEYAKIRLGFRMLAPKGWWLELRPRSSSHAKKHLNCLYGVIDQNFENELIFSCQWLPQIDLVRIPEHDEILYQEAYGYGSSEVVPTLKIEFGDRIGQVIPVRRQEMTVQEVSNDEFERLSSERAGNRGGGLGSTG